MEALIPIFGFFLWLHIVGNPFEELSLILGAKVTDGFIIDTYEDYLKTYKNLH